MLDIARSIDSSGTTLEIYKYLYTNEPKLDPTIFYDLQQISMSMISDTQQNKGRLLKDT